MADYAVIVARSARKELEDLDSDRLTAFSQKLKRWQTSQDPPGVAN